MSMGRPKTMPLWLIWIIAAVVVVGFSAVQVGSDEQPAPARVARTA